MRLLIEVDFEDDTDFDFARVRCVAAVEGVVDDLKDEGRMDGDVEVSWEVAD
jgi:hypothetical protein